MKPKKVKKIVDAITSTLSSLLIIGYIAAHVFGVNIWILKDLSIVQFVLIMVGGGILLEGVKKIIVAIYEKPAGYDEEWGRWDSSQINKPDKDDLSFNHSYPPPPPPPDGSFSNQSTTTSSVNNNAHREHYKQDSKAEPSYTSDYKELLKQQFKQQKDFYKEQKNKFKEQERSGSQFSQSFEHNRNEHTNADEYRYEAKYEYNSQQYDQYSDAKHTDKISESTFIGDFKFKKKFWQLKPMELNAFIGDGLVDLTSADIPVGETLIRMNTFIGDLKVHAPNDPRLGIKVKINAFIGDSRLFEEKRSGFGVGSSMETPYFSECERRIVVELNSFIGDVKVKRVG